MGGTWVGLVMSAMIMTGTAIGGLFKRVGWVSLFLFSVYLLNSYVVFIHGE